MVSVEGLEIPSSPESPGPTGVGRVLLLKPKVVLTLTAGHDGAAFVVAAKIEALKTVHSLLPFWQIPFYSESLLQVKWSNCKRFLSIW